MAPALDASTPTAVTHTGTATSATLTTASFTPPAGSVLVACLGTNSGGLSNIGSFAITDDLGSHLTYTALTQHGNTTSDTEASVWWAPVATSAAMTVSVSFSYSNTEDSTSLLRVLVFTGADTTGPIGANGGGRGRTTNISGTAAQYNSTRGSSWGWLVYADWTQSGIPTVPVGETVDASYQVTGSDSYAVIKNDAATPTAGTQVTLTTSTPTSSLQLAWTYFEVLPALVGPTIGSVPSGTALATPAFTAKFLFFDTGDYGIGV